MKPSTVYTVVGELKSNKTITMCTVRIADNVGGKYFTNTAGISLNSTSGKIVGKITTNQDLTLDPSKFVALSLMFSIKDLITGEDWIQCDNLILLEGDHTNTPIEELPYGEGIYSVGENEVTEDGKHKISGKSCGKNLLNLNDLKNVDNSSLKLEKDSNGVITLTGKGDPTNETYVVTDVKVYLEKGKNYYFCYETDGVIGGTHGVDTVEVYFIRFDPTMTVIRLLSNKVVTCTESGYYRLRFDVNKGNATHKFWNLMVCESDSPIACEPYQESTYSYILNEPLRSLPNGVADTIEGNKVVRRVGKVVLDGILNSAHIRVIVDDESLVRFNIKVPTIKHSTQVICDKFPYFNIHNIIGGSNLVSFECICPHNGTRELNLVIKRDKLSTIDIAGFNQWLQANPTTVYYELAEPIIEELDETLQLKSFNDKTHIISDNYLMPITSAKIPSNVQAVVSSLMTENKELIEEVSTLSVENEELKQTNEIQDELIDINMCATDEMYVLLEPLLAQSISTMSLEREVSKMVDLYVAMIQRGLKTIEQVPERYREQVREVLEQLEK